MELRHLRYFIAVAEELNFTRAARRLDIEQPPLSLQIRQLESEVGTALLQRLPRGVALTDAGRVFLDEARAILAQVQQAVERAQQVARGTQGQLRVGMINSAPFHPFVPRVIREFGERYPDVHVTLAEDTTQALALAVLKGTIDIAFLRPLLGEHDGLDVDVLFDEDMLVALPEGHALTHARTLPLTRLSNEDFVLFPREIGSGLYDEILTACRRAGFSPRIRHEIRQVTSIANLVAADLGVSLVPASMQQVLSNGVVYRSIEGDAPKARMCLAYASGRRAATVENFLALVRRAKARGVTKRQAARKR